VEKSLPILVESSIQVAWDYLEGAGELGEPKFTSRFLLDTIESMVRCGERRQLMLSNKAIDAYRRFRDWPVPPGCRAGAHHAKRRVVKLSITGFLRCNDRLQNSGSFGTARAQVTWHVTQLTPMGCRIFSWKPGTSMSR
jgi:hypothetical protein